MPYPSQIDERMIIRTARQMIEADGVDGLSLNKLSATLNVKTPSLYRYFENRHALLQAVIAETLHDLFQAIREPINAPEPPTKRALAVAINFRLFAHAHPVGYGLAFTNTILEIRPDPDDLVQAVLPYQALMAEIVGMERSLTALRGFLALIHGYVMLELASQLQRGGDLEATFVETVKIYLAGLNTTNSP